MNKLMILFFPLMLASLACVQTTINAQPTPTSIPTKTEIESGAVFEVQTFEMWQAPQQCASVNAALAVNLRQEPGIEATIIRELLRGETVTVHKSVAGWTAVTTDRQEDGYIKSEYLTRSECP